MAKYKPLPVFWPSLNISRYVNSCRVLDRPKLVYKWNIK